MTESPSQESRLHVAIVGGGIVGLILAAGLVRRGVRVDVYEQARGFREIGAGMAFTANAIQCMELIDPAIVLALRKGGSVSTSNETDDPNDYLRWVDGYNEHHPDATPEQQLLYKIDAGYKGFEGTRRDQFLENLVSIIPNDIIHLRKRLDSAEWSETRGKVVLAFADGSTALADAVVGADGIKSQMRKVLFGPDNPAAEPQYTHKCAYRCLIPMDQAEKVLGSYKARNQHMHVGPNAHVMHYPVANGSMINVTCFVTDHEDWPRGKHTTQSGTRQDMEVAFRDWGRLVREIIKQFPQELEKWAVFDMWEFPAPFYSKGRICLAGDAAHASSPHHGAGACSGVEDVLCLVTLVEQILADAADPKEGQAIESAFQTYDEIRRPRSQWLVNSSRRVCDLYQQPEWADPKRRVKAETCFEEIKDRSHKIWHFDHADMVRRSIEGYRRRIDVM